MKTTLNALMKSKKNVIEEFDREIKLEIKKIVSNFKYHKPVLIKSDNGIIETEKDAIIHYNSDIILKAMYDDSILKSIYDDNDSDELFELEDRGWIFIEYL